MPDFTRASATGAACLAVVAALTSRPMATQSTPAPDTYVAARLAVVFGGNLRGTPEEVESAVVSPDFFPRTLTPVVGRFLTAADGADEGFTPVVISNGLFYSRYGGTIEAVETPLLIEGQRLSVVGVAPQDFQVPEAGWLWLPRVQVAGTDPRAALVAAIDGVWDLELSRDGQVMWPRDMPERQLASTTRGRLTLAAVGAATCTGCLVVKGTLRVPLTTMLPEPTPARLRLLPERPAGDDSRAVTGMILPGNRVQVRTISGNCQLCGEIALDGALIGPAVSGDWSLETAAVGRPGDHGTFSMRRVLTFRMPRPRP